MCWIIAQSPPHVSNLAIDFLQRLVSKMPCYVPNRRPKLCSFIHHSQFSHFLSAITSVP